MKRFAIISCLILATCCGFAAEHANYKSELKVASDGFPTGHETPEGAACDLARAFIRHDDTLFTSTCIRLYDRDNGPEDYAAFLQSAVEDMIKEAAREKPSPEGPKSIGKVFAARHLSKSGPTSFGHAKFGFYDIMFVDVVTILHNGERSLNRTLVIKDKDRKWYVHPLPMADSGMLAVGLNDETPSKKDFSEAYVIHK